MNNFDFDEESVANEIPSEDSEFCPSCGAYAAIDGPTLGCTDRAGCGVFNESEDEESDADEHEDEEIEELDFE